MHALLVAIVLWSIAAAVAFVGTGNRSFTGRLKGADFVEFYTLGSLVRSGQLSALYDVNAFSHAQATLVPDSAGFFYPPLYPPQTGFLFAPLASMPYGHAILLWTLITAMLYAAVVWRAYLAIRSSIPDAWLVALLAMAFPPFWQLVLHGQITAVVLGIFCLGWMCLEKRRPFLAGCVFGLLAMKPQLGLVLAAVMLIRREWRIISGAVTSVALQAFVIVSVLGASVLADYVRFIAVIAANARLLEPRMADVHSLRALLVLLPGVFELPLWALASAGVIELTAQAWSSNWSIRMKMAFLIVATVLVSPHLIVYDCTLLALPIMWMSEWVATERPMWAPRLRLTLYAFFMALLLPTASFMKVQLSVILMLVTVISLVRTRASVETELPVAFALSHVN